MSECTHTRTPWEVVINYGKYGIGREGCGSRPEIGCLGDKPIDHANVNHIVACVNACEGINPKAVRGMLAVLKEISEGKGRYSMDPFEHAQNTVEDMKGLAIDAIYEATH